MKQNRLNGIPVLIEPVAFSLWVDRPGNIDSRLADSLHSTVRTSYQTPAVRAGEVYGVASQVASLLTASANGSRMLTQTSGERQASERFQEIHTIHNLRICARRADALPLGRKQYIANFKFTRRRR